MTAPATRQRMLRQLLVAVLDAPAPSQISFDDDRPRVTFECDSADDARALAKALRLRDRSEDGQPYPHTGVAEHWTGWITGSLLGWNVHVYFKAPFAGEFVDRWDREGGFRQFGTVRPDAELAVSP